MVLVEEDDSVDVLLSSGLSVEVGAGVLLVEVGDDVEVVFVEVVFVEEVSVEVVFVEVVFVEVVVVEELGGVGGSLLGAPKIIPPSERIDSSLPVRSA